MEKLVIERAEPNGVGLFSQQGMIETNKGFLCAYYVRNGGKKYEANYDGANYSAPSLRGLVKKIQKHLDDSCQL